MCSVGLWPQVTVPVDVLKLVRHVPSVPPSYAGQLQKRPAGGEGSLAMHGLPNPPSSGGSFTPTCLSIAAASFRALMINNAARSVTFDCSSVRSLGREKSFISRLSGRTMLAVVKKPTRRRPVTKLSVYKEKRETRLDATHQFVTAACNGATGADQASTITAARSDHFPE